MNDPDNDKTEETPSPSLMDSIEFIVDMMNDGGADASEVYPPGRYQGD